MSKEEIANLIKKMEKKSIERLKSREKCFDMLVKVGIYNKDGKMSKEYR